MKRQIKFRGKRVNGGEWVESMTISHGTIKRKSHDIFFETGENAWVGVIPETVGQFTGLVDKNGKEIYEGDIVQLDYITTSGRHRIGLSFEVKWCTQEGCWVGWDGFVENAIQQTHKMFVVKGNIHDNPELIEVNKES